MVHQAIQYLIARKSEDGALGDTARSTENIFQTPDSQVSGSLGQRFKRKYSIATLGRNRDSPSASSTMYQLGSRSESHLLGEGSGSKKQHPHQQGKLRMSTASGNLLQKRPETPAAEYMAALENASPRSVRSYSTQAFADELGDLSADIISVNGEVPDEDDDGYEGLENVRVCCGEHDINQLSSHRHDHHHHGGSHSQRHRHTSQLPQPSSARASSSLSHYDRPPTRQGKKSLGSLFTS